MADLPEKPVTRKEQYLAEMAGVGQGYPEKPITREEQYLAYIAENGGTGGGGTGAAAGFGKVTITIDGGVGEPSADVVASGPNTAKNFDITLHNIKGEPGEPGTPGENGKPGFSPTVEVDDIDGGHKVTITDESGQKEFDVMDGKDRSGGISGVTSFNNRTGDVMPQSGDYSAEDVGARPDSWTPTAKEVIFDGESSGVPANNVQDALNEIAKSGGTQGPPGAAAGFGDITVSVDDSAGNPSGEVDTSGPNTALNMAFKFSGLKGADGAPGSNGTPGKDGAPGVSPTVKTSAITGGNEVTITDASGAHKFSVMNGKDGASSDIYSLDEVRIGAWIDGRPLYRKVFMSTLVAYEGITEFGNLEDVDTIVSLHAIVFQSEIYQHLLSSVNAATYYHEGKLLIWNGDASIYGFLTYLTVTYTKSSDNPTINISDAIESAKADAKARSDAQFGFDQSVDGIYASWASDALPRESLRGAIDEVTGE